MTESYKPGADFDAVHTDPQFKLGEYATGSDGTEWVYVQAGEAISQYDAVAIDEDYQALQLTTTEARMGHAVGWAQVAFANDEYGWVVRKGSNVLGTIGTSCGADAALYATAVGGVIDDAGTSLDLIDGVVAAAAAGTAVAVAKELLISSLAKPKNP